jgi:hypothetical protein
MEQEIMRKMIELIGWSPDEGDGIFTPGVFIMSDIYRAVRRQREGGQGVQHPITGKMKNFY